MTTNSDTRHPSTTSIRTPGTFLPDESYKYLPDGELHHLLIKLDRKPAEIVSHIEVAVHVAYSIPALKLSFQDCRALAHAATSYQPTANAIDSVLNYLEHKNTLHSDDSDALRHGLQSRWVDYKHAVKHIPSH